MSVHAPLIEGISENEWLPGLTCTCGGLEYELADGMTLADLHAIFDVHLDETHHIHSVAAVEEWATGQRLYAETEEP